MAITLNGLALANKNLGKLDVAEKLPGRWPSRARAPGDQPDTRTLLGNIASARRALGRYPEALDVANEALAMNRRIFGGDNPTRGGAHASGADQQHSANPPRVRRSPGIDCHAPPAVSRDRPDGAALESLADIQRGEGKAADARARDRGRRCTSACRRAIRAVVGSLLKLADADAAMKQWPAAA